MTWQQNKQLTVSDFNTSDHCDGYGIERIIVWNIQQR